MVKKNEGGDVGKNCIVLHDIVDILTDPLGRITIFFVVRTLDFNFLTRNDL